MPSTCSPPEKFVIILNCPVSVINIRVIIPAEPSETSMSMRSPEPECVAVNINHRVWVKSVEMPLKDRN
ncbi:hypothetical protein D3C87_1917410 [compost metagenome]